MNDKTIAEGGKLLPLVIAVFLAVAVFGVDLLVPLGFAGGVLYLIPLLITLSSKDLSHALVVAVLSTFLTLLGFLLSPSGGILWIVLLNRGLALMVIWATMSVALKQKTAEKNLLELNIQLESLVTARTSRLVSLNEENRKIAENLGLEEVLQSISDAAIAMLEGDYTNIYLLNENSGEYQLLASSGIESPDNSITIQPGEGRTGKVIQSKKPMVLECTTENVLPGFADWTLRNGLHSYIGYPLHHNGKVIGAIGCTSKEHDFFGDDELELLSTLASQATIALTNAKLHEEAQHNLAFFRSIVDDNTDAIIITDQRKGITHWNPGAEKLYGYSEEEVLGKDIYFLAPHSDDIQSRQNEIMGGGKFLHYETTGLRKNGLTVPLSVTISPIKNEQNIVISTCIIQRDITRRKESETRLLDAKSVAEEASQAKSNFLSNMSHELRTPLNAIVGFSDILLRDIKDPIGQTLIPKIRESGLYLSNLIEDILDIERIENGKIALEVRQVDINNLVKKVAESWHPQLSDKCSLALELDTESGNISCDAVRVRQILTNLLDNANKYSPEGGEFKIRTHSYHDEIWISVEDHGIGMSPNEMQGIFERFNQLESGYKRRSGGLGIGLSLIRELVEMHGGRIWAESEEGQGSTFLFALPREAVAIASEEDANIKEEESGPWMGKSILVVDDIEHYHEFIKLLMADASIIHSAYNGKEGIEIAQREQPDIILMDLRMPILDGFEAIKALKSDPRTQKIPILAVTAQAMARDRSHALELGAEDLITKPIDLKLLEKALHQALENHQSPSNVI